MNISLAVVWAWIVAHQLGLYFILAVLIEQLPPPVQTTNALYRYFYSVVQVLAANFKRSSDAVKKT